jgi:hypothetical protein
MDKQQRMARERGTEPPSSEELLKNGPPATPREGG